MKFVEVSHKKASMPYQNVTRIAEQADFGAPRKRGTKKEQLGLAIEGAARACSEVRYPLAIEWRTRGYDERNVGRVWMEWERSTFSNG